MCMRRHQTSLLTTCSPSALNMRARPIDVWIVQGFDIFVVARSPASVMLKSYGRGFSDANLYVHTLHYAGASVFVITIQDCTIALVVEDTLAGYTRVVGLAALKVVHMDTVSNVASATDGGAAISILRCFAGAGPGRRQDLLEKLIKGFAQWG